ncbi:MAG: 1-acyl-sn-glycerol-3-phosphate acyltransferase, partial [Oscillospiraceae bacterium]|nr:1-acyl-sn-glycerol-3-phosphate acyltransferase [Oscillospiraceae bacterium]
MTGHEKFYRFWRPIITVFTNIFLRLKISGRENIPSGAAVVVANHSSNFDALVMITALGKAGAVRILAKAELYKIPIVGPFLRAIGTIRVDRSVSDINAVKESLAYLKAGGKIGIFPEGRRVSSDEA